MQKVLVIFLTLGLVAGAYHLITSKDPVQPPNDSVHEENFDRLRAGMTEVQVESILGSPHRKVGGEIVQLERPGSIDLQGTVQEQPDSPDGSKMNVYLGRNEESIEVLFSAQKGTVIAAEYHVGDYPVIYRGPRVAKRSEDLIAIASSRIVGSSEKQKQKATLAMYQRRKMLEKHRSDAFFGPTDPDSTSSPVSLPAPIPSESHPSQGQSSQQFLPAGKSPAPAAAPAATPPPTKPPVPVPAVEANVASGQSGPFKINLPSGKVLTKSLPTF